MNDKPSYLGLLNAIAVGEARGYQLLSAWAKQTDNIRLADVLNFVAIRENEHAAAFTKRLSELGFAVRESSSLEFDAHLTYVSSDATDHEKYAKVFGSSRDLDEANPDPLATLFADESIDPKTGALLGRFIAEERDSDRRLTKACVGDENSELLLEEIADRLDRLTSTIEEFKISRRS